VIEPYTPPARIGGALCDKLELESVYLLVHVVRDVRREECRS